MARSNGRAAYWAAIVLGCGCLLIGAAPTRAQEKDEKKEEKKAEKQEPADKQVLLSKTDKLTDEDPKDTGRDTSRSHRKLVPFKMVEGKAYRIDLSSSDFDSYLRLEDAAGKQVAANDDAGPGTLNSRILFVAPKTGEYRIVVTSFDGKIGEFKLEVKPATEAETAEARLQTRLASFADSPPAEQKKMIAEVVKDFRSKGENLTIKDAQLAMQLVMSIDEADVDLARKTAKTFGKLFDGASNKQLSQFSKFLDMQVLKNLDKLGTEIEIAGKTTDGKSFDLKNLKGKVVLVDFWATWCGPCVAEIPNMVEAHKKYHGKGFEVIGVSLDRNDEAIVKFLEDKNLPWQSINIDDSLKLAKKYGVNAIPQPILVDRDGRIVSMRARGPMLHRSLERLFTDKK